MRNDKDVVEECKKNFKDHTIKVIHEDKDKDIHIFRFSKPGTSMYGFNLTIHGHTLVLTGDIGDLLIRPTQLGMDHLLNSIEDFSYYFPSKIPNGYRDCIKEYDRDTAEEMIDEWISEGYLEGIDKEDLDWLSDEGQYGEFKFGEFCYNNDIESSVPRKYKHSYLNQVAGLMVFVERYKELPLRHDLEECIYCDSKNISAGIYESTVECRGGSFTVEAPHIICTDCNGAMSTAKMMDIYLKKVKEGREKINDGIKGNTSKE